MNLSLVIATMNREKELLECLESVHKQTLLPNEIIIVDDGNLETEKVKKAIGNGIGFQYHKKTQPSLSASRNKGARMAAHEFILFLDDDVILEPNFIEEIMRVYKEDKKGNLGGVAGIIVNTEHKPKLFDYWERIFLMNLGRPAAILPWGFHTRMIGIKDTIPADWIPGGLACFRREVFENFQLYDFQEFGHKSGRHGLADIEFGFRVRQKYRMAVTPHARLYHYPPAAAIRSSYKRGYRQAYNHGVIYQKYVKKTITNALAFFVAMNGLIWGNFGAALMVKSNRKRGIRLYRAWGNLVGFLNFLLRK